MLQKVFDRDFFEGEVGKVFLYGFTDIDFSILVELHDGHGRERLGNGSQLECGIGADGVPVPAHVGKPETAVVQHFPVFRIEDLAAESAFFVGFLQQLVDFPGLAGIGRAAEADPQIGFPYLHGGGIPMPCAPGFVPRQGREQAETDKGEQHYGGWKMFLVHGRHICWPMEGRSPSRLIFVSLQLVVPAGGHPAGPLGAERLFYRLSSQNYFKKI